MRCEGLGEGCGVVRRSGPPLWGPSVSGQPVRAGPAWPQLLYRPLTQVMPRFRLRTQEARMSAG